MEPIRIALSGDTSFRDQVVKAVGQDLFSCYQCYKCSAGCPVAYTMDLLPHRVIRLVLLLQKERALSSRTIWICASCETCTTRCPNNIDVAKVMDALREMQIESGTPAHEPKVPVFHKAFLDTVRRWGRVHELSMLQSYSLKSNDLREKWQSGEWKNDVKLGMKMFLRGKLKLMPHKIKDVGAIREIFDRAREYRKK
jgi:heterodisulfide reductase subunit C2